MSVETFGGEWRTENYKVIKVNDGGNEYRGCENRPLLQAQPVRRVEEDRPHAKCAPAEKRKAERRAPRGDRPRHHGRRGRRGHLPRSRRRKDQPIYGTENPSGADKSLGSGTSLGNMDWGSREVDPKTSKETVKEAHLYDGPQRDWTAGDVLEQSFETTALAVEGAQKDTYFGSVEWGYKTDDKGTPSLMPLKVVSMGVPSSTFMKSAEKWNNAKVDVSGTQTDTQDLPLSSHQSITKDQPRQAVRRRLEEEDRGVGPGDQGHRSQEAGQPRRQEQEVRDEGAGGGGQGPRHLLGLGQALLRLPGVLKTVAASQKLLAKVGMVLPVIALACAAPSASAGGRPAAGTTKKECAMEDRTTIEVLEKNDLAALTASSGPARDALGRIPDVQQRLLGVVHSTCGDPLRFKAAEAWFALAGDGAAGSPALAPLADEVAQLYVGALRGDALLDAWGLPSTLRSSARSRHLIALGPAAVRALRPLLDDRTTAQYGDEESSLARMAKLRRCDLAAALIASARGEAVSSERDPAVRDKEIAALKKRLG